MYKRYPIGLCKTEIGIESAFLYKYFLTESQKNINRGNNRIDVMAYGIEATCEKIIDNTITMTYGDTIECISPNKEKVLELIEFLRKHEVSPIHLIYIAGPFVDDWVKDFDAEADMLIKTIGLV